MSYFPAGWPSVAGGISGGSASSRYYQERAVEDANSMLATYSAALNMGVGATTQLLFTTAADRGRFFPLHVTIAAVYGTAQSLAGVTAPTVRIGWYARSNPYDNWVNQVALTAPLQDSFGSGNYNIVPLETWEAFLSAPPSTPVYLALAPGSGVNDVRVVTVVGIYLG